MENPVPHTYSYEAVAAGQTDQLLGTVGKKGQLLERLILTVSAAATSAVSIKDGSGSSAIPILAANTPIGVYTVELRMRAAVTANPGWFVTTAAGVTAIGVGNFGQTV